MFLNGASFLRFDGMRRMAAMERDLCGRRWTVGDVDGGVEVVDDVVGDAAAGDGGVQDLGEALGARLTRADPLSRRNTHSAMQ